MIKHLTRTIVATTFLASQCAWAALPEDVTGYQTTFFNSVPEKFQVALPTQVLDETIKQLKAYPQIQALTAPEFVVVANRNPKLQTISIFLTDATTPHYIGSAKISTGAAQRKEYFITPVGIFENKREHGNYRAEGTKNENGVRGLGIKGMRVFDFGWQDSIAGWGAQGPAKIRLQMHATDPALLEQRLGTPASKGCVRIPTDVNKFIDVYGVLDQNYKDAPAWMTSKDKQTSPYDGRYMVVVDIAPPDVPAKTETK